MMVGVLIISHGDFADGLLNAAEMIMGKQDQVLARGLQPEESPEGFQETIRKLTAELDTGDGVMILADLFGGSPANSAAYLVHDKLNVDVVTGVSLPMLLEVLTVRTGQSLAEIASHCVSTVQQGVRKFSEVFSESN